MGNYDHLVNFDIKNFKKNKEKAETIERNQLHAENAFHSELSRTNKKRNRTKKKRNYNGSGYSYVYDENGKLVLEHRRTMEQYLGRKLLPHEAVKFADGNKENLDISNLQLGINPRYKGKIECPNCKCDIFAIPESDQ